jgi:hypothetical protein
MPVQRCYLKGKPGFRWGKQGKCYTYSTGDTTGLNRAKSNANRQGRAIKAMEEGRK